MSQHLHLSQFYVFDFNKWTATFIVINSRKKGKCFYSQIRRNVMFCFALWVLTCQLTNSFQKKIYLGLKIK